MIVSILPYNMNIQSGRKGADWKSDQLVKGTKYGLSRILDEENPAFSKIDLSLFHYVRAEVNPSTNIYLEPITGDSLLSYTKPYMKVKQVIY